MVEKEILKKIFFLQDLSDPVLEKFGAVAHMEQYAEKKALFQQNQNQPFVYMLVSGKVLLASRPGSKKPVTLDQVTAGRIFGASALLGESSAFLTAVCAEPSEIVTISGEKMRQLCEADVENGHKLMLNVVKIFK